jgi:hypothetical protein
MKIKMKIGRHNYSIGTHGDGREQITFLFGDETKEEIDELLNICPVGTVLIGEKNTYQKDSK